MNHFFCFALLAALFMGHQGTAQVVQPLQAPSHAKGISMGPTGLESIGTGVFFNPALAREAGQWNPTITQVHKPLPDRIEDINEETLKTQAKLELIQQYPNGWPNIENAQRSASSNPSIGKEWENLGAGGWIPPDNTGAISGDGWIVSAKNSQIGYYDVDGNTSGEWSLSDFFSPVYFTDNYVYDPRVEYSNYHDKWIVVALGGAAQNNTNVLVAFSISNNPNDGFWLYNLGGGNCSPGNVWFDYPKTAVSATELFVTGNLFNNDGFFQQATIYQIELADAWTGGSITYQWYCAVPDATGFSSLASSIVPLGSAWTASSPGMTLVAQWEGAMTYYYIDNSLGNNPSLTAFPVSGDVFAEAAGDVFQLGSSQTLDGGGNRLRDGFFYNGTIHVVHNVAGQDGFWKLRYAQIDYDTGQATVFADYGATGFDYNYPSIDPWGTTGSDWDGSVVMGFLRSSSTIYPEFRAVHFDNGWGESFVLKEGVSPIESERWGDYIDGAVRENQGQIEVWLFGQYGQGSQYGNWVTQLTDSDPVCPYDLNSDGNVTISDVLLILSEFGCSANCTADLNGDGTVTVEDLLVMLSGFLNGC